MTSTEKVFRKAEELILAGPTGKRFSELIREVSQAYPEIPINTVRGSLHKFSTELPSAFYKPTRGLYKAAKYQGDGEAQIEITKKLKTEKIKEEDFYDSFGTVFKAVWSRLRTSGAAKLVTVHFFDRG